MSRKPAPAIVAQIRLERSQRAQARVMRQTLEQIAGLPPRHSRLPRMLARACLDFLDCCGPKKVA